MVPGYDTNYRYQCARKIALHRYKTASDVSTTQVIVSPKYCVERRVAYRLGICRALIRGIMIDDCGNIVGMCVNTVSTKTADSLGRGEHEMMDEGE